MARSTTKIVSIASAALLGMAALLWIVQTGARTPHSSTVKRDVWVGDTLPSLPSYFWGEHEHSLVLAAQVDCPHCKASVPFYQQLRSMVAASTDRVGVVAVFPNSPDKVRAFLDRFHLDIPTVSSTPLQHLAVSGTPTLILADSKGTVIRVWIGELDTEEQRELFIQLRSYLDRKAG
jgi:hypothetical protein